MQTILFSLCRKSSMSFFWDSVYCTIAITSCNCNSGRPAFVLGHSVCIGHAQSSDSTQNSYYLGIALTNFSTTIPHKRPETQKSTKAAFISKMCKTLNKDWTNKTVLHWYYHTNEQATITWNWNLKQTYQYKTKFNQTVKDGRFNSSRQRHDMDEIFTCAQSWQA